ncbi:MAG: hypothetical protein ACRD0Z_02195 [Acidimicrobiales bacterium]
MSSQLLSSTNGTRSCCGIFDNTESGTAIALAGVDASGAIGAYFFVGANVSPSACTAGGAGTATITNVSRVPEGVSYYHRSATERTPPTGSPQASCQSIGPLAAVQSGSGRRG